MKARHHDVPIAWIASIARAGPRAGARGAAGLRTYTVAVLIYFMFILSLKDRKIHACSGLHQA